MHIIFLSLFSLASFATEAMDPTKICADHSDCTPQMRRISNQFASGTADFAKLSLSAYSGNCFHLNSLYDPDWIHHGAFVFETQNDETIVSGVFSFFAPGNPYAGMSPEELRSQLSKIGSPAPARRTKTDLILEFLRQDSEITYWFRTDPDAKVLSLIGYQRIDSDHSAVFCELIRH